MPLFQKFDSTNLSNASQTKGSEQRKIRQRIADQYPALEEYLDVLIPPKSTICAIKCKDHITLITANKQILFFQERDGPYYPTLRLLQAFPEILPVMQCDIGGCRFVLGGANVMCQGLTSGGGKVAEGLPEKAPVQIRIEGKRHPIAMGMLSMSSDDIKEVCHTASFSSPCHLTFTF